jgi:TRAP-type C4-dicarboxylate transport system permease large subunit
MVRVIEVGLITPPMGMSICTFRDNEYALECHIQGRCTLYRHRHPAYRQLIVFPGISLFLPSVM